MATKSKVKKPTTWDALVLYDPTSRVRFGVYGSEEEADREYPRWQRDGWVLAWGEVTLSKRKR
jgi:hypothetical protein